MKKICFAFTALMVLLAFAGTGHTVTSSLDNVRGGAGIAYWQAAGGWSTLVNVQEAVNVCADIHVGVYDRNDTQLMTFSLLLSGSDNVGVVVEGDGVNISLYDYSDSAYGGTPALNDVSAGPAVVLPAPADADGIQRGYMTFVRTNTGCGGPGGAPDGNITGAYAVVPDNLFIRSAMLTPNSAFAVNAAMFQGFANQNTPLRENSDFIDSTNTPNFGPDPCDFNHDGTSNETFTIIDDAGGADIDFVELFLSDNITVPLPWIICDGGTSYRGLGAHNGWYCSRFNSNPTVGTSSILVLVAPQSTNPSAAWYDRTLTVYSFDDEGNSILWSSVMNPVAAIPFGAGGINIGAASAGESCFFIRAPVFGFSFTESASFADLYPIGKSNIGITTLNQDGIDDAVDTIHVP